MTAPLILCSNFSDDGEWLKETKMLMYTNRENHGSQGYVTKTDMFYAKKDIFAEISEIFCFLTK